MDDDRMSVSSGSSDLYEPAQTITASVAHAAFHPVTVPPPPTSASPKRSHEYGHGDDSPEKRMRLEGDGSRTATPGPRSIADNLPTEIWQSILSYLTPPELGRLMCVSKRIMGCLDGSTPAKQRSIAHGGLLQTVDADSIWATWRITHPEEAANMPKPLEGSTERDMWNLIRGTRCDQCEKIDAEPRKPISPDRWHGGPTMSTTRAVWPFALRLCGECLFRHCEKDTALLCNPSAKQFRPALPYAFVTHDFHYIPTTVLKEAGQAPSGLHVAKQYFKAHIDQIIGVWEQTLSFGQGAAEEWLKGLSGMGALTAADSARWEHWEAKGGLNRILFAFIQQQPAPLLHPTPTPGWVQSNMLGWPLQSVPPQHQQFGPPPGMPPNTFPPHPSSVATNTPFTLPPNQFSPQAPMQNPFGQPTQIMQQPNNANLQQRLERNPRDAEGAKAARRLQIEQRCLTELDPPIPPNVLRHMPSFRAAIQIGFPLNDPSWEALKPKLLEQRDPAVAMELETTRQLLAVQQQVQAENRRHQANHNNKDTRDTQEKEWEETLRPQRERLGAIADNHIRQHWRGGQSVNSGNVARFAMSVFDHVRKTFYAGLQGTDQIAMALGQPIPLDPPDGPFLRRLTLETMKWVYDHKIRPLTRDYGKEIFFCNGAGCEFTNKHFAFEGVIQHFGAKHTNDYSKGNVIVHWQTAEWPEDLPFYDPGSGPIRSHYANGGYQSRGTTISPQATSGAPFGIPSLGTSPFGPTPHSGYNNGPFTPPAGNVYLPLAQQMHQGFGQSPPVNMASQATSTSGFDPTDLSRFFATAVTGKADPAVAKAAADKVAEQQLSAIMETLKAQSVQPPSQGASGLAAPPPRESKPSIMDTDVPDFAVYQDQLKFVAETARFAWTSTNAIHGMPSSVRVFAVLQYTVLQFSHRFSSKLSIDTFAAALMNNPIMDPIKRAVDLFCHQCQINAGAVSSPLTTATELLPLTSHFQSIHAKRSANGHGGADQASWVKDMIALPPPETIPELINAPGMTDDKLAILADAFAGQLPRRLPRHKDAKDTSEGKQGKRNKRGSRNFSNGRRHDFEDANNGDTEDSGQNGLRPSRSPPDANGGRRRSPKFYGEDDEDEYDPSKPAMTADRSQKKRREFVRKPGGQGQDLASLLQDATERSNKAAAEENRRRGIVSEVRPEAAPIANSSHDANAHVQYHIRVPQPSTRPDSAPRPAHVYANDHEMDDRRPPYGGYPPMERSHPAFVDITHPERSDSRSARLVREGYDDTFGAGTPPSGRKSRYARYDEQERIMRDRTRSRSPVRFNEADYGERNPIRQREYLAPERPPLRYRYADEVEPMIRDPHTGRMMILVREDAPPPPGYAVPRRSPGEVEYVDRQPYDPRYYEYPPDPRYAPDSRYDPRLAPLAHPPMPAHDVRYAE